VGARAWWLNMPPRCQRLLPAGYPDASLSAQTPSGADGRRLAAGRASDALAGSAGTVGPPRRGCLAAPPHGTTGSSSAVPCHTRSRCRRFADSEGRDTVDSPVAPSHAGGLDSGFKYGHTDRAGGPPSPKATLRGAESSPDLTPPASFLLPILSQLCGALPTRLHTRRARDEDADGKPRPHRQNTAPPARRRQGATTYVSFVF
jgi:hypothetical protein